MYTIVVAELFRDGGQISDCKKKQFAKCVPVNHLGGLRFLRRCRTRSTDKLCTKSVRMFQYSWHFILDWEEYNPRHYI